MLTRGRLQLARLSAPASVSGFTPWRNASVPGDSSGVRRRRAHGASGDGSIGGAGSVSGVSGSSGPGSSGIGSVWSSGGTTAGSFLGSVPGLGLKGGAGTPIGFPLDNHPTPPGEKKPGPRAPNP